MKKALASRKERLRKLSDAVSKTFGKKNKADDINNINSDDLAVGLETSSVAPSTTSSVLLSNNYKQDPIDNYDILKLADQVVNGNFPSLYALTLDASASSRGGSSSSVTELITNVMHKASKNVKDIIDGEKSSVRPVIASVKLIVPATTDHSLSRLLEEEAIQTANSLLPPDCKLITVFSEKNVQVKNIQASVYILITRPELIHIVSEPLLSIYNNSNEDSLATEEENENRAKLLFEKLRKKIVFNKTFEGAICFASKEHRHLLVKNFISDIPVFLLGKGWPVNDTEFRVPPNYETTTNESQQGILVIGVYRNPYFNPLAVASSIVRWRYGNLLQMAQATPFIDDES